MRAQLGPVVSHTIGKLLSLQQVRAELDAADRGAALVTKPRAVAITTKDRESTERTLRRWGHG